MGDERLGLRTPYEHLGLGLGLKNGRLEVRVHVAVVTVWGVVLEV